MYEQQMNANECKSRHFKLQARRCQYKCITLHEASESTDYAKELQLSHVKLSNYKAFSQLGFAGKNLQTLDMRL
jgi:hypothetical protein